MCYLSRWISITNVPVNNFPKKIELTSWSSCCIKSGEICQSGEREGSVIHIICSCDKSAWLDSNYQAVGVISFYIKEDLHNCR